MRLIIIPDDGFVSVDGAGYLNLVYEIDPTIHAVQWFDTSGWIEYKEAFVDGQWIKPQNQTITSIDQFSSAIDAWIVKNSETTTPVTE